MRHFIYLIFCFQFLFGFAQLPVKDWHHHDFSDTSFSGISTYKTYQYIGDKKPQKKVIVAVIDGGTDHKHEDLKSVLWINKNEIINNGIDDDKNGYIDDIHGWNFLGGKNGDVEFEQLQYTRTYSQLRTKYEGKEQSQIEKKDLKEYQHFLLCKEKHLKELEEKKQDKIYFGKLFSSMQIVVKEIGVEDPSLEQIEKYKSEDEMKMIAKKRLLKYVKRDGSVRPIFKKVEEMFMDADSAFKYHLNPYYNARLLIGDNPMDYTERNYGNNHYDGPEATHGTAVAGCIAAQRDNTIGMEGISNNSEIMILRAVPNGDERDKDIANSIRYAVDNGASIINMSFGKRMYDQPEIVEEAFRYAISKDVLLVHAAGNDGDYIDKEIHFPNNRFSKTQKEIPNLITVGASDFKSNPASFSNYGPKSVDVFAPGKDVYTCFPGSKYDYISGTSFACPVTTGVAALLRAYFPELSAAEIKKVILKSVNKIDKKVPLPSDETKLVKFNKLCKTGGVIDTYNAFLLAEKMYNKKINSSKKAKGKF